MRTIFNIIDQWFARWQAKRWERAADKRLEVRRRINRAWPKGTTHARVSRAVRERWPEETSARLHPVAPHKPGEPWPVDERQHASPKERKRYDDAS